jgi:hypothetical protein
MPRGVYARKSAQQETTRKVRIEASAPVAPSVVPAAAMQPALAIEPASFSRDDFRKPIGDMSGALLKAFARSIGIKQRDVDGLTEDRLRQNCKVMQLAALED